MITIRKEQPGDADEIHRVNEKAFGRPGEANLVNALRRRFARRVSLVALEDEKIVGHILFSPVTIEGATPVPDAVGLAPLAAGATTNYGGIVKYPAEFNDL